MDDFFSGGCWDEMMNLFYKIGGYDNQDTHDAFNRFTERYKQYLETSQKMHALLRAETMSDLKALNKANGYKTD